MTGNPSQCHNCDAELHGRYCSKCGQRERPLDLSLKQLLSMLVEEVFAFDDRLLRTLRPLLFKPGYLAREYLAGKRARYVPPFRLYLAVSFLMFVVLAFVPNRTLFRVVGTPQDTTVTQELDSLAATNLAPTDSTFGERLTARTAAPGAFDREILRRLNQVMFVLVPVFALLLKMTHRRVPFVRHLVYAVYLHAFAFLLFTLVELPGLVRVPVISQWIGPILLWIPIYFYLGMRRMYGEPRVKTLAKAGVIGIGYLVSLFVAVLLSVVLAVLI